jgi:hypothetical protein
MTLINLFDPLWSPSPTALGMNQYSGSRCGCQDQGLLFLFQNLTCGELHGSLSCFVYTNNACRFLDETNDYPLMPLKSRPSPLGHTSL